ncbi:MAG: hypothetical protein RI560_07280 [Natronomonas sp.]|nr:hypothetical protein [Natronomonas sp.]
MRTPASQRVGSGGALATGSRVALRLVRLPDRLARHPVPRSSTASNVSLSISAIRSPRFSSPSANNSVTSENAAAALARLI